MMALGRGALESLARLWVAFGGLGLVMTSASLVDSVHAYPGWQWTIGVSVALVLGGIGVMRRNRGARWIVASAVAGGLAEAAVWLWWTWTPILVATAVFHTYGLVVLMRTEFWPIARPSTCSPASATEVQGRSSRRKRLNEWWY